MCAAEQPVGFFDRQAQRAGRDDGFQEGAQARFGLHTDELVARGGIAEGDDGGDGAHVESRCQVGVGVHVHLGQAEAAAQLAHQFFQQGGEHLAGLAPLRPKIHHHGGVLRIRDNLEFEISFRNVNDFPAGHFFLFIEFYQKGKSIVAVLLGRGGLIHAHHLAMHVDHHTEAEHAQVGEGILGNAGLEQLVEVAAHILNLVEHHGAGEEVLLAEHLWQSAR